MNKQDIINALTGSNQAARGFRSDFDLNESLRGQLKKPYQGRKAAVLVPIVMRDTGPTIILTQRTDHLPTHAGQISFPGGKIDKGDKDAFAAAVREAKEEIGLDAHHIDIIGTLDEYETSTGFHVTPVVAFIAPDHSVTPEPGEVAEIFEVPLSFVMDTENHRTDSRVFMEIERFFYAMPYGDYYIWGATAAMLVNLQQILTVGAKE